MELSDEGPFPVSTGGSSMPNYRFDRQQDDGTWSVQEFQSVDDQEAITYGLSIRTANRCELYQAHRWLATFDGAIWANDNTAPRAIEKANLSFVWTSTEMETESAYFRRRASEEKRRGKNGANAAVKIADDLESLARAIDAERRRRNFYDVNASRGVIRRPSTTVSERPCERGDGRKVCYSAD